MVMGGDQNPAQTLNGVLGEDNGDNLSHAEFIKQLLTGFGGVAGAVRMIQTAYNDSPLGSPQRAELAKYVAKNLQYAQENNLLGSKPIDAASIPTNELEELVVRTYAKLKGGKPNG
jgi:hypothetical protein